MADDADREHGRPPSSTVARGSLGAMRAEGELVWRGHSAYAGAWLVGEVVHYDECGSTGEPGWATFLGDRVPGCHATEAEAKRAVEEAWADQLDRRIADLDARSDHPT